ncbi:Ankyrin repeat-containing domain protein [Akanthomyces lecanii RCEF 1005]|uniref:Ankyrin repeat-containing domain protein n=1 Tax=Akanthomyces lecanii RCEF 1005 TaxID=1081108 RepID=A0A168FBA5_CORDF|nr:Ankyrin repeat-containing domain protein [Akanthomyces lecanii RCEF 1005]
MQEVFGNYSPEFEPRRRSSTGNALYIVASLGDIEMAKLLKGQGRLQLGASNPSESRSDPNVVRNREDDSRCPSGNRGQTALAVAVCQGHDSVVRVLCADWRVDINLAGPDYRPPFFYAVRNSRWDIADILYKRGATYDAELAFEQACVDRRLDWMIRLIRVTEFNEYRLQDWHDKAYGHLKTCLFWLQVGPELDRRRDTYAKNWATGQSPAVNEASVQR